MCAFQWGWISACPAQLRAAVSRPPSVDVPESSGVLVFTHQNCIDVILYIYAYIALCCLSHSYLHHTWNSLLAQPMPFHSGEDLGLQICFFFCLFLCYSSCLSFFFFFNSLCLKLHFKENHPGIFIEFLMIYICLYE